MDEFLRCYIDIYLEGMKLLEVSGYASVSRIVNGINFLWNNLWKYSLDIFSKN